MLKLIGFQSLYMLSCSTSPGYYTQSSEILPSTPTPHSSDYTVNENDYLTPNAPQNTLPYHLAPKFANSFFSETWILMRRNFKIIRRTPELFLSRLFVLTIMGFMMATMFINPKDNSQGITNRLSFFIFTVCLFFFSSNDAVPAFMDGEKSPKWRKLNRIFNRCDSRVRSIWTWSWGTCTVCTNWDETA